MKSKILLTTSLVAVIAVCIGFALIENGNFYAEESSENSSIDKWANKAKSAAQAAEWREMWLINEETGKFEPKDRMNAIAEANALMEKRNNSSRAGQTTSLTWEFVGPDNVGGRTRAILIDKDDPMKVFAGGVAGGLYKSMDGGISWNRVAIDPTIFLNNISSIAQAPNGDMYIGTGEPHSNSFNDDGFNSGATGRGIFKSTDGGLNWRHLSATDVPDQGNVTSNNVPWYVVSKVACDPTDFLTVYASTVEGMYVSRDSGNTFTQIISGDCDDVEVTSDGTVYFARSNDVYTYDKATGTEVNLSTTSSGDRPNPTGRMEIAVAPSNPNYVYVLASKSFAERYCLDGIYQSKDKGATWKLIGPPAGDLEPFAQLSQTSNVACQGWYDNTIAVNSADEDKIYVGGVTFWTWGAKDGWVLADNIGRDESHPYYIHADKHTIVSSMHNPEVLYVGHDGGVVKSTNALSAFPYPTYKTVNKGYGVTQFYSIAASIYGQVFGGTQDNSSPFVDYKGNTREAAKVLMGGDGGFTEISRLNTTIMFGESQNGALQRSGNGGQSFSSVLDANVDDDGDGSLEGGACGGFFINPFWLIEADNVANNNDSAIFTADRDYGPGSTVEVESRFSGNFFEYNFNQAITEGDKIGVTDPYDSKLYMSTRCGLWINPNPLSLAVTPEWFLLDNVPASRYITGLTGSNDGNSIWIALTNTGRTSSNIYKITGINQAKFDVSSVSWSANADGIVSENKGSFSLVRGIDVDNNDDNHVVISLPRFGSTPRIFETTDGGTTWNSIQGDLPNMPLYDVAVVEDPNGFRSTTYVVASELGTWITEDGGTTWQEANNGGLSRGPVFRLREEGLYQDDCRVIYAGTHGQGAFRTVSFTKTGCDLEAGKVPGFTSIDDVAPYSAIFDFNVYPNPISSQGKVALVLEDQADIEINIIDMPGRVVKEFSFGQLTPGDHQLDFNVNDLPKGNYVITVRSTTSSLYDSKLLMVQ